MDYPTIKQGEYAAYVADAQAGVADWVNSVNPAVVVFYNTEALRSVKDSSFNALVVDTQVELKNKTNFGELLRVLQPGGTIQLMRQNPSDEETLLQELVLSGFVNSTSLVEGNAKVFIKALKPGYKTEAAALPLKLNKKAPAATDSSKIWKLNANDFNEDAYELEDEEALLNDDVVAKKAQDAADCGPAEEGKKKRACKNCVCGLKEMQEAEEKGLDSVTIKPNASACGNCSKGDAFRCASCPYLGTPTFDSGAKPTIKVKEDGSKVLLEVGNETL